MFSAGVGYLFLFYFVGVLVLFICINFKHDPNHYSSKEPFHLHTKTMSDMPTGCWSFLCKTLRKTHENPKKPKKNLENP